ncbi:MAG: hypothetical protein WBB28_24355 [Crinalium sp.]
MSISETQTAYFNTLINLGVTETDAQQAAHILYEVDSQRPRTTEEQALISKIFTQVQDRVQGQLPERTNY